MAVYTKEYTFMYGSAHDAERQELPFQDIDIVKRSIDMMPIYLRTVPLNDHPYLGKSRMTWSTRIKSINEVADDLLEVRTASGTVYRLIKGDGKAVYASQFTFMYGNCHDEHRQVLPYQDVQLVMKSIGMMPIYLRSNPITKHPTLGMVEYAYSTRIESISNYSDNPYEVRTASGTVYRLIVNT